MDGGDVIAVRGDLAVDRGEGLDAGLARLGEVAGVNEALIELGGGDIDAVTEDIVAEGNDGGDDLERRVPQRPGD